MKNATTYEKKVRKLLAGMKGEAPSPQAEPDPVRVMIESIFEADTTAKAARQAVSAIEEEFVDFNELRVARPTEIVECVGANHPRAREKAEILIRALNRVFQRASHVSMGYMEKMTKRDLRRHLSEIGLDAYSAAAVTMRAFAGHAVPVDQTLVECLEMDGSIGPGSDIGDVQGFLERIVAQKDGPAAHALLREHVAKSAKALAKRRREQARAAAKAAEEAAKAAEAARKAEAEKKAAEAKRAAEAKKKAEAKKEAAAKRKAATKAKARRKAAGKAPKKKSAKAARKTSTRKTAAGKAAGKASKRSAKKAPAKKARKAKTRKKAKKSTKAAKRAGRSKRAPRR